MPDDKTATLTLNKASDQEKPADPAKRELPAHVKMKTPYAYYEDGGRLRSWAEGEMVTDPSEIALLVERKAPFWVPA